MHRALATVLIVLAASRAAGARQVRTQDLTLTPEHVHWGYYDSRVPPALRMNSGERVRVETMVAGGLMRLRAGGATESEIPDALKAVEARVTERGPGAHPMTGPIFVDGAQPGDVLAIHIVAIEFLHPFGVVAFAPGGGVLPDEFPYAGARLLRWQPGADHVDFKAGVSLKFAPFFGSIGVAPPAVSGRISSRPPGWHGGNLDNKDLVVGSTLYLPVHVAGALLSIGDGHALQADGEVTGTALETSLRGTFEIRVIKGKATSTLAAQGPKRRRTTSAWGSVKTSTRPRSSPRVRWSIFLVAEKGFTRDERVRALFTPRVTMPHHAGRGSDQRRAHDARKSDREVVPVLFGSIHNPGHTENRHG